MISSTLLLNIVLLYKETNTSTNLEILFLFLLIPFVILSIFLRLVYYYKVTRKNKLKKLLTVAQQEDYSWDNERLKKYAIEIYKIVQLAWSRANIALLNDICTPKFLTIYEKQISRLNISEEDIIPLLNNLKIEVEIIGAQDYEDNLSDRFAALIKINNKNEVIYHFMRGENTWLLEWIQLDISFNGQTKPLVFKDDFSN